MDTAMLLVYIKGLAKFRPKFFFVVHILLVKPLRVHCLEKSNVERNLHKNEDGWKKKSFFLGGGAGGKNDD